MFLATVVYDNDNGLITEIFTAPTQEEVVGKAIDNLYDYATEDHPLFEHKPPIWEQLDMIKAYFSDCDDRAQIDFFNLETLERCPPLRLLQ